MNVVTVHTFQASACTLISTLGESASSVSKARKWAVEWMAMLTAAQKKGVKIYNLRH